MQGNNGGHLGQNNSPPRRFSYVLSLRLSRWVDVEHSTHAISWTLFYLLCFTLGRLQCRAVVADTEKILPLSIYAACRFLGPEIFTLIWVFICSGKLRITELWVQVAFGISTGWIRIMIPSCTVAT